MHNNGHGTSDSDETPLLNRWWLAGWRRQAVRRVLYLIAAVLAMLAVEFQITPAMGGEDATGGLLRVGALDPWLLVTGRGEVRTHLWSWSALIGIVAVAIWGIARTLLASPVLRSGLVTPGSGQHSSSAATATDAQNAALQQYGQVMSYLQYENNMYWNRSAVIVAVNTALYAAVGAVLVSTNALTFSHHVVLIVTPLFGLILTIIWVLTLVGARWWIRRWLSVLLKIEETGYGGVRVMRGAFGEGATESPPFQTYLAAYIVAGLFMLTWLVIGVVCVTVVARHGT